MFAVPHFLGKDVTGIDLAIDVTELDFLGLNALPDTDITKVDMPHALRTSTFGPVHCALIVIEERSRTGGVGERFASAQR